MTFNPIVFVLSVYKLAGINVEVEWEEQRLDCMGFVRVIVFEFLGYGFDM
jgi:hypothetical protein